MAKARSLEHGTSTAAAAAAARDSPAGKRPKLGAGLPPPPSPQEPKTAESRAQALLAGAAAVKPGAASSGKTTMFTKSTGQAAGRTA